MQQVSRAAISFGPAEPPKNKFVLCTRPRGRDWVFQFIHRIGWLGKDLCRYYCSIAAFAVFGCSKNYKDMKPFSDIFSTGVQVKVCGIWDLKLHKRFRVQIVQFKREAHTELHYFSCLYNRSHSSLIRTLDESGNFWKRCILVLDATHSLSRGWILSFVWINYSRMLEVICALFDWYLSFA